MSAQEQTLTLDIFYKEIKGLGNRIDRLDGRMERVELAIEHLNKKLEKEMDDMAGMIKKGFEETVSKQELDKRLEEWRSFARAINMVTAYTPSRG